MLVGALVAAGGGWWTPWANRYIQGVDVSHHQGRNRLAKRLPLTTSPSPTSKPPKAPIMSTTRFAYNWREAE